MKVVYTVIFLFLASNLFSQSLYTKSYGENKSNTLIFLHGGPGYNSASFEATTAQKLADNGFFVIVYDRRGEGRSTDVNAKFTFEETSEDINNIYTQYGLTSASLIGHSFGGIVGTLYAEKYPDKVNALILVSAPVSLQESFNNIINRTKKIYEEKNDSEGLKTVALLERMDNSSLQYSSLCFMEAMKNGFYATKNSSVESKKIRAKFVNDSLFHYSLQMTPSPAAGFWKNEKYTTMDITSNIQNLISKKVKIYGIYGVDDGLYSKEQVIQTAAILGENNLQYLPDCSHSVFIDQQEKFVSSIKEWTK